MSGSPYPKRLIEVDLPIKRISAHARREKSIRHGHISTLHIWWARRPLAACRAVICAALWPDPGDPICPPVFREAAVRIITAFAKRVWPERINAEGQPLQESASAESLARWEALAAGTLTLDANESSDWFMLRMCLLDFIADFANWDNSTVPAYLETARMLTAVGHASLSDPNFVWPKDEGRRLKDESGATVSSSSFILPPSSFFEALPRPLVVDPFCGGGSIPLEALRVGADAFASDLNPIPVLLNKVVLEYIPKYGKRLAEEVRKWGEWIKREAEQELAEFYPKDPDGATPIAYLWARTIRCEGPACGAEVPLIKSLWLAKTGAESIALEIKTDASEKRIDVTLIERVTSSGVGDGTVRRSSATCPLCGYTTPANRVRAQFKSRAGGAADARLLAIRFDDTRTGRRGYRLPVASDIVAVESAKRELGRRIAINKSPLSLVPDEELPYLRSIFNIKLLGVDSWGMLFAPRQALSLVTLAGKVLQLDQMMPSTTPPELRLATKTCLALVLDRLADFNSSLCVLNSVGGRGVVHTFGRQALGIVWDFMETNPFNEVGANWESGLAAFERYIELDGDFAGVGVSNMCSATEHPLPNDSAGLFVTDPPYYDAVPYADLSDFFYVWLKRMIGNDYRDLFSEQLTRKEGEIVQLAERNTKYQFKTRQYFEELMQQAMTEGRRVLSPSGVGIVVFAHKTTTGWETQLQAMVNAGWVVTASWPIDTERPGRLRAQNSAALASSVHLVCRPREDASGAVTESVGEWRDVLGELPQRIHEWMPRLASEGVVGADAIFACLGPALEIFSRYRRVEKANGDPATLREYLEFVWAAVATEALSLIFKDADASSLEPDARLTAMWLWTLGGRKAEGGRLKDERKAERKDEGGRMKDEEGEDDDDESRSSFILHPSSFILEYDAARKIAQGLGVNLEQCQSLVEVKGDKARLLPVSERTQALFGKVEGGRRKDEGKRKKKVVQKNLFEELGDAEAAESGWGELKGPTAGKTVLDQVHQSMILFAAGRGELMKRFLVEDGIGKDARFWILAQSLSALYPKECEEKRWVDGVLARKKGLGL